MRMKISLWILGVTATVYMNLVFMQSTSTAVLVLVIPLYWIHPHLHMGCLFVIHQQNFPVMLILLKLQVYCNGKICMLIEYGVSNLMVLIFFKGPPKSVSREKGGLERWWWLVHTIELFSIIGKKDHHNHIICVITKDTICIGNSEVKCWIWVK